MIINALRLYRTAIHVRVFAIFQQKVLNSHAFVGICFAKVC